MALHAGDDLLHRSAGGGLDDDEVEDHDAEQGRRHEQQPAQDVGGHRFSSRASARAGSTHQVSGEAEGDHGHDPRPREPVPVDQAVDGGVPVGDHVVAPGQHPVQGPGHGHLLGAGLGGDQALHQLVHHRVADAGVVAAARRRGRGRGPVVALLVARRQVLVPDADHHVVVVLLQPAVVLGRVHGAAGGGDAEPLQVEPHRSHDALVRWPYQQELEGHGLARLLVDQGAVTLTTHPASRSMRRALRRLARIEPSPSVDGARQASPKTSSGTLPR